ncbi:MAG TPA: DUF4262 domain-containing protein [Byssovorax sp.]
MKPALAAIARNIAQHGHHVYVVSGSASPRFAYTVGLVETLGHELVLAGAAPYSADQVHRALNEIAAHLGAGAARDAPVDLGPLGTFSLRGVSDAWVRELMLGALDYYPGRDLPALQVVPDVDHLTIDVPRLDVPWSAATEPAWRFSFEPWPHAIPRRSVAATHTAVLRGAAVIRAARWEDDLWELFACPSSEVSRDDLCVVPLGVLLGAHASLGPVVDLAIGEGLRREDGAGAFEPWRGAGEEE